ncbi:MAG: hypothetical protein JSV30_00880 [Candidatus Omnitrophota bacterium]|nr:MAG: hypothetical protein JSV30_00880 [Candidatus Omnitrophota bacterium]
MPKINVILLIGLAAIVTSTSFAEEFTLTTYYPAPYGVYREMRAQRMAIGDNFYDASAYCWQGTCTDAIGSAADLVVQGDVGIGTHNPSRRLTIAGSGGYGEAGAAAIGLENTSATGTNWQWHVRDDMRAQLVDYTTAGITRFLASSGNAVGYIYVDGTDGNVGIAATGTFSPVNKLDVDGAVAIGDTYAGSSTAPANGLLVEGNVRFNSAIARQGSTLAGNAPATHVNLGASSTTGWKGTGAAGYATVGGGYNNKAILDYTTVAGGSGNKADNSWSTVGGGKSNSAIDYACFIGGGDGNSAKGDCSSILGGKNNQAADNYSTVAGGIANKAIGRVSFAAGALATARHDGSFVWADYSESVEYASNGENTFNILADGGIYFTGAAGTNNLRYRPGDIAEFVDTLKKDRLQEAEIVSIVDNNLFGRTTKPYDENLMGVISGDRTCSFYIGQTESLKEEIERLPIALAGPVYVKVTSESGNIAIGDSITSSAIAGVGMKATRSGKIIGYAMENEDFSDAGEIKEILVFVNIGYYMANDDFRKLTQLEQSLTKIERLEEEIEMLKAELF